MSCTSGPGGHRQRWAAFAPELTGESVLAPLTTLKLQRTAGKPAVNRLPERRAEEVQMARTVLVASGQAVPVATAPGGLVQVDVEQYRTIRITVANAASSPSSIDIAIAHIMSPGTPAANAIELLDSYTLGPDENVSKSYDVPGQTIALEAFSTSQTAGCTAFFTIYGRPD